MLGTRLRLRPWLEQQINSGLYPGVQWIDQAAGVFQIPWKHAARHGWSLEKDASLFRNWAIHTGRHRPGVDKPDPKTWKANFRCALNSLSDVRELQEKSRKRGHDAFRVYALLPQPRADGRTAPRCSRGEGRAAPAQTQRGVPLERPSGLSQIWSEEEEQTEAVLKIVDHLKTLDHSAPSYESERSWRDSYMWTGCLCDPVESSGFLLHPDGSFQQSSSAQFQEI